ncbi:SHC-transforming protein 1 isoform X1 [Oreochromis niloticus]|uniref:SHC-transforming protein 1 isoform X1 n=2 Tax=Oreochromis niloticus TaxID=8128 RepID=UPI000394427A|nr:SHC-transforming protein 4 isoform X1 [Oreochromis niloticus]XP_025760436.1 SHC-transforming protein 4 isoform X1 [Oreochromis niloticus]
MREQTLSRFKSQTGLLPGMLKRTKYSRLRNDSPTSLEENPQRMLPLKQDLCLDSEFSQLGPGITTHHGPSTLRDFIPRMANIRLQSPISRQGLKGQTDTARGRSISAPTDKPLSRTEWGSGSNERFCTHPSLNAPLSTGQNLIHPALLCTKRPITLHRMASLPWTPGYPPCSHHRGGLCCVKISSAKGDRTVVGTGSSAVHHHIKYMGSVEVTQSMRTLDFDTRMQVTREAISRLCARTLLKTAVKTKRPVCKGLSSVLGQTNLQFSGSRIILTVSTDSMTLIAASSLQKIAHHPMQTISFASGGDSDMADYIAYVAKDLANDRACHILECPEGQATEVINSIGQAFETRFRHLLSQTPSVLSTSSRPALRICHKWCPEEIIINQKAKREGEFSEHRDYYNVTPGDPGGIKDFQVTEEESKEDANINRVCFSRPVSLYENCSITDETPAPPADLEQSEVNTEQRSLLTETRVQKLIQEEGWFHGRLGREQAESLLTCSGDFLVRESSSAAGQYVLSGMEGATVRHLLLVDPHGQVRTRDQVFLSVGHLVRFHMENQMPIVSGSSELCLKQPILQTHKHSQTARCMVLN